MLHQDRSGYVWLSYVVLGKLSSGKKIYVNLGHVSTGCQVR